VHDESALLQFAQVTAQRAFRYARRETKLAQILGLLLQRTENLNPPRVRKGRR
jgi:hypothetical protein